MLKFSLFNVQGLNANDRLMPSCSWRLSRPISSTRVATSSRVVAALEKSPGVLQSRSPSPKLSILFNSAFRKNIQMQSLF